MRLACERLGEVGKINGHYPFQGRCQDQEGQPPMGWFEGYRQGESLTRPAAGRAGISSCFLLRVFEVAQLRLCHRKRDEWRGD